MSSCYLCPRACGVNRAEGEIGFCGMPWTPVVSRVALHHYEEPPISGTRGSGTIFFCGCSLRCVFCQNKDISRDTSRGKEYSVDELCEAMLSLRDMGAHNVNLVTPTHFSHAIAEALKKIKSELSIPVVYNTSGYETVEALAALDGLVDVYMPDLKYFSPTVSEKYSSAPDYFDIASKALVEMFRQVGSYEYRSDGMLKKGVLVRHLVLPSCRKDSEAALRALAEILPPKDILLSLMRQYTPEFAADCQFTELKRKVTSFEYDYVAEVVRELGFDGFIQTKESASAVFTPEF